MELRIRHIVQEVHMRAASSRRPSAFGLFLAVFLFSQLAHAGGGLEPLDGFFDTILDWVTSTIAPAVVVLSIVGAGISWAVMGSQEGLRKAVSVAIGAALIYGAGQIFMMLKSAAGH
jgi:type IV secretory pathway VirB2 component (pilin)